MLKCDQPRGWKVADHPPKEPQKQLASEGERKARTMMIMTMKMMMMIMMMILMMTIINVMYFLHAKGPLTGLAPGGQKTMMIMMIMMIRMMLMMIKNDDDDAADDVFLTTIFFLGFLYLKLQYSD